MAGFDFDFTFTDRQRPYVEACIRAGKTRARQLDCSWRVIRSAHSTISCVINGQTRRLDLLGHVLEKDLPIVCEGVASTLPPRRAAALGRGFAEVFLVGRDVNRGIETQALREVADTSLYYPVYELTSVSIQSSVLQNRLQITEGVVSDYGLGRVTSVVVLEELHTAVEQVLRYLLPRLQERANWPRLVASAEEAGYLSTDTTQYLSQLDSGHDHTDRDLLLEGMNRRRNAAKHKDGDPEDPWVAEHWECASLLLERLVQHQPSFSPGVDPVLSEAPAAAGRR